MPETISYKFGDDVTKAKIDALRIAEKYPGVYCIVGRTVGKDGQTLCALLTEKEFTDQHWTDVVVDFVALKELLSNMYDVVHKKVLLGRQRIIDSGDKEGLRHFDEMVIAVEKTTTDAIQSKISHNESTK